MRKLLVGLQLCAAPVLADDCTAVDWLLVGLPAGWAPVELALETAYPGSDYDAGAGTFTTSDGLVVPLEPVRDVSPRTRLDGATIDDMFFYTYPLDFDLVPREIPWEDPGRVRNDALMRALWFDDEASARASLASVRYEGSAQSATLAVTTKHCVHAQLRAAFVAIADQGAEMDRYLTAMGGTFNWRKIAGTDRLSAHSFGTAIDFNTAAGGYWRWSGATPGEVGALVSDFPQGLIAAMERFGFIWGGKWHHYDSFHFEYRPELILHARLFAR